MKRKLLRTILPLAFVFTLMSCSTESPSETPAVITEDVTNYAYESEEMDLADLINEYRVSIGKKPLDIVNYVSLKSEEHNEYMIANNVVNHDKFEERSNDIINVLGAVKVNENVAYNYSTPRSVLYAWLKSPGHKANIEGDFTSFGISIRTNPTNGNKYFTNIFIKK